MSSQLNVAANVTVYDSAGNFLCEGRNTVTNVGTQVIARFLVGETSVATDGFNYVELGTGVITPDTDATELETPIARSKILKRSLRRVENTISIDAFFFSENTNVHLREAGLYVGDDVDTAIGSGMLFARVSLNLDNSGASPKDIVLNWRIQISPA